MVGSCCLLVPPPDPQVVYALRVCDLNGGCGERQFPVTVVGIPVSDTAVAASKKALADTLAQTDAQTTNEPIPSGVLM